MAASRSSCANCRRMFRPDSRASMTSVAPVACTVREVASRCSASSINVIRHDGISPFGVAIAPEYCTDAIFILTEGGFFGDAAGGGASFPTCCGAPPTRPTSSCFVMYDPRLPLCSPTTTQQARRHLLQASTASRARLPRSEIQASCAKTHHSLTVVAAREGGADQGSQWPLAVRAWPNSHTTQNSRTRIKLTHNRVAQAKLARLLA